MISGENTLDDTEEEVEVRRVNGKRFVTEERLQQFGRELKNDLKEMTDQMVTKLKKVIESEEPSQPKKYQGKEGRDNNWKKIAECYVCHQIGHISEECRQHANRQHNSHEINSKPGKNGYSSMFRRSYVQKVLCSEGPLFRRSYAQKVLCSKIFVQKVLCLESTGDYLSVLIGHTTLNQRQ